MRMTITLLALFFVSGCSNSDSAPTDAEKAAAKANARSMLEQSADETYTDPIERAKRQEEIEKILSEK